MGIRVHKNTTYMCFYTQTSISLPVPQSYGRSMSSTTSTSYPTPRDPQPIVQTTEPMLCLCIPGRVRLKFKFGGVVDVIGTIRRNRLQTQIRSVNGVCFLSFRRMNSTSYGSVVAMEGWKEGTKAFRPSFFASVLSKA